MSEFITEAEYATHIDSVFRINAETPQPIELKLVEVNHRETEPHEEAGMERFSLVFTGPTDFYLQQQLVPLVHEILGPVDLFLVPLGLHDDGFRYEAVFNYYKPVEENSNDASA